MSDTTTRSLYVVPTPNEWLADVLSRRKNAASINGLARALGRQPTQVQRWVSGREQIPRSYLAEMAHQLVSAREYDYVLELKNCEDFADHLAREIGHLAQLTASRGLSQEQVEIAMASCLEHLIAQEPLLSTVARAKVASRYLVDAVSAIRAWRATLRASFLEPLITPANVSMHLRYPSNHFVGQLLSIAPLREEGLAHVRALIDRRWRKGQPSSFVRQHAIHLLARYGEPDDRAFVKELLENDVVAGDPMSRRLAFTGLSLSEGDPETIGLYVSEMARDPNLARAGDLFDAVHYGDAVPYGMDGVALQNAGFDLTIPQVLRHLEQPARYQGILTVDMLKLVRLLETVGAKPFLRPQVHKRLLDVLTDLRELDEPKDGFHPIRKEFQKSFTKLLTPNR